jgi:hypothetical protein
LEQSPVVPGSKKVFGTVAAGVFPKKKFWSNRHWFRVQKKVFGLSPHVERFKKKFLEQSPLVLGSKKKI